LNILLNSAGYIDHLSEEGTNCTGLASYRHVISEHIPVPIYCMWLALSFWAAGIVS